MSEKIFNVLEESTGKEFKLSMTYDSSEINFDLESKDNPNEKYELKNLTLEAFQKKNKIYKLFEDTTKIADIISNKIENKNFVLNTGCILSLKYTNEYDQEEYIPFEIKKISSFSAPNTTDADDEIKKLKSELERFRKENAELKAQIEKLSQKTTKQTNTTKSEPEIEFKDSYIPPSMDKNGSIWDRIDHCLKLKKDMKKTLEELLKRLNESKKKIDNFVDKAFANNPTIEDRKKALSLITEVLLLRQGFRDIDDYQGIFTNEVKEKGIKFNAEEKEKFDDSMLLLGKSFPYSLTPFHQQIDHLFIQVVHNFFKEKNLRFYKPDELKEVNQLKRKVM